MGKVGTEKSIMNMGDHDIQQYIREFLAEALGTFALVIFGDGAVSQVVLGNTARGDAFFGGFLNICFGYGLALMIGIAISGGVSGAHLNPAVTLAMAVLKKTKPIQVPIYMAAQYLGAFLAAVAIWGEYADAIKMVELIVSPNGNHSANYTSATHGIFASYPFFDVSDVTTRSLAVDQILGTAMLLIIVLAVTDDKNMKIHSSMIPITIGLGLTAIHLSFGLNAGSAINPARDFSPRLLSQIAGWKEPFLAAKSWFWIPWLLPHVGAVIGAGVYTAMISIHHKESEPQSQSPPLFVEPSNVPDLPTIA